MLKLLRSMSNLFDAVFLSKSWASERLVSNNFSLLNQVIRAKENY